MENKFKQHKFLYFMKSVMAILLSILIITLTIATIIFVKNIDDKDAEPIKSFDYEYKIDGVEEYKIIAEMNTEDLTYRYEVETDHQVFSTYDSNTAHIDQVPDYEHNKKYTLKRYDAINEISLNKGFSEWKDTTKKEKITGVVFFDEDFYLDISDDDAAEEWIMDFSKDHKDPDFKTYIDQTLEEHQIMRVVLDFNNETFRVF